MRVQGKQSYARTLLFGVCLLGTALSWLPRAHANDSVLAGSGGGWRPLKDEHHSVRIVSEKVSIDASGTGYSVTADFVFRNSGKAATVAMGFPENGAGDIAPELYEHKSGFKSFLTFVDGKVTPVRRLWLGHTEADYSALWVKHIQFTKGQTRRVRVRYESQSGKYSEGSRVIGYQFTGGNWNGDVDESVLTLRFRSQVPGAYIYHTTLSASDPHNNSPARNFEQENVVKRKSASTLVLRRTHWQAQANFAFNFVQVPPVWLDRVPLPSVNSDTPNSYFAVSPRPNESLDGKAFAQTTLGLEQGGTTFVNLQLLAPTFDEVFAARGGNKVMLGVPPAQMTLTWDARDNSLLAATRHRRLRFWPNKSFARREDGALLPLQAKPFRINRFGNTEWYVPLQPMLEMLGATAEVNAKKHLLTIH